MKFSEMKEGEVVMMSKADFEDLKRQCFRNAVKCLSESIRENLPDGDEMGKKLLILVDALNAADVAAKTN